MTAPRKWEIFRAIAIEPAMKVLILLLSLAGASAGAQTNAPTPPAAGIFATTNLSSIELGEQVRAACIQGRRTICGRILRVLPEGLIVECGYTNLAREPLTKSWLVPGTVVANRPANLVEGNEPDALCVGEILLTDLPKTRGAKPHPYDYVIIRGYPSGHYTYESVGKVKKTVRRFSANLTAAVKINFAAAASAATDSSRSLRR